MRMIPHEIKPVTITENSYGEPVATAGTAYSLPMAIGWVSSSDMDKNNALYQQYQFVGVTRGLPTVGSIVDDKYTIGHIEKGRLNRCFMNYCE